MKTAEEISKEIFYKPATNGKAEQSIKEGAELIERYAQERVTNALKEAAEKARVEAFRIGEYDPAALNNFGYRVDKESILSLIKDTNKCNSCEEECKECNRLYNF